MRWIFAVMLLMCASGVFFHGYIVAGVELAATFALWVYFRRSSASRRRALVKYMDSISMRIDSAGNLAVADFPLPLAVVDVQNGELAWANDRFLTCWTTAPAKNPGISATLL
jgi:c-di-AMP phosphodiesterase-like protein